MEKVLFEGEAEKVIAKTPLGEITVLDNHLPIITPVKGPSVTVIDKSNKNNTVGLMSGFLEVKPNSQIIILAN